MRRGFTTWHETLGNAAVFFFSVVVPDEFTHPLLQHLQRYTTIKLTLPIEQSGSFHAAIYKNLKCDLCIDIMFLFGYALVTDR